jgi:hypothetical protein
MAIERDRIRPSAASVRERYGAGELGVKVDEAPAFSSIRTKTCSIGGGLRVCRIRAKSPRQQRGEKRATHGRSFRRRPVLVTTTDAA